MKKVFYTLIVISIFTLNSCCCGCVNKEDYNYKITADGKTYYTKSYTKKEDGCVKFIDVREKEPIEICGNYTLTQNLKK